LISIYDFLVGFEDGCGGFEVRMVGGLSEMPSFTMCVIIIHIINLSDYDKPLD